MRDTHHMRQRQGFVLLTVTLVAALLFISALMFVSQLTTENHVTKTDAYFKSALNIAETGLSNTLMDISQSEGTETWAIPFKNGITTVLPAEVDDAVHGTFQETVQVIGAPTVLDDTDPNNVVYSGNIRVTSIGAVYPPSVSSTFMRAGSGAYVARRAVLSNAVAEWTHSQSWSTPGTPDTFEIKYGVFTGGNLVIKGSSQEIHGDVFANGDVYIQKASGLVGGDAYAGGTVTGGIPDVDKFSGQKPIEFPEIDIASLQGQFDAYLRGLPPYDGSTGLTDTSHTLDGEVNRAKYHVDVLEAAAREDPITHLYELPSMVPITADVRSALIDPTAVYYFDGDVKLASNSALAGTIVIDGKFFIAGNVEVGTAGTLVNIIATGNVTKDTGCSLINGVVYTGGSFTGRGTADINGALIARNSVDMSGNFNITYKSGLPGLPIDGDYEKPHLISESYILNELKRVPSGESMWQEVTDLN